MSLELTQSIYETICILAGTFGTVTAVILVALSFRGYGPDSRSYGIRHWRMAVWGILLSGLFFALTGFVGLGLFLLGVVWGSYSEYATLLPAALLVVAIALAGWGLWEAAQER